MSPGAVIPDILLHLVFPQDAYEETSEDETDKHGRYYGVGRPERYILEYIEARYILAERIKKMI
jgi:hypothetical protein